MPELFTRLERACHDAFLVYGQCPDAALEVVAEAGDAHRVVSELPLLAVACLQVALDAPPELKPAAQAVAMATGLGLWLRPWRPCEPSAGDQRALERLRVLARLLDAGPGPADCDLEAELAAYGAVELLSWGVEAGLVVAALQLRPIVLDLLRRD
jgi:hypothetical protein